MNHIGPRLPLPEELRVGVLPITIVITRNSVMTICGQGRHLSAEHLPFLRMLLPSPRTLKEPPLILSLECHIHLTLTFCLCTLHAYGVSDELVYLGFLYVSVQLNLAIFAC